MKNVRRIITSSKSDKTGPSSSRPLAKRSRNGMEGAGSNTPALGAGGKHPTRRRSGSAVASLVPGAKAADAQEVILTVRLTEKQAAVFKDMADCVGATPGEILVACACSDVSSVDGGEQDKRALEVFSAVRTFVREKKTPVYPEGGLSVYDFCTQEGNG